MDAAHHFLLADLGKSLLAEILFPLFVLIPGYALGWLFDLFEFRRRSQAFRICLGLCVSMAVCPIATYVAERFGTAWTVWALYAAAWVYFLWVKARRRGQDSATPIPRLAVIAVAIWAAVATFSLIDLQIGSRDYYSITALDYSVRTQFTHSIAEWGIPARNPFYFPGHPVAVRYHYLWLILCAMVERAGAGLVGPRDAWIAGAVWCGIGLMSVAALALRTLLYRGAESFRRRVFTMLALLTVTGLDILPAALGWLLWSRGMRGAVLASIDWWNEQVDGFVSTALWEAHHLAGLVACITSFLLLWEASQSEDGRRRVRHAVVGGVALASSLGISIYVALVFGAFLAVWVFLCAMQRRWREVGAFALAGAVALLFAAPYLSVLRAPAVNGPGMSGPPLQFQVRPFSPAVAILDSAGVKGPLQLTLANLLLLPLNYFLELGFFFVMGRLWWSSRKKPLPRAELAISVMLAVSLLIATFVRSSVISNNDLGWRGILLAQFVLLLWAVDVVTGACGAIHRPIRYMAALMALLGVAGTVYDIGILRFYPLLSDQGAVTRLWWMGADGQVGARNYAQREAYEWLNTNTARQARIQYNPHVPLEEIGVFLYGRRQIVAANMGCLAGFGGDETLCPPIVNQLERLYPENGLGARASIADTCAALPVDVMIAKDSDPVWKDRESWVWKEKPIFANPFVRLFRCVQP